MTGTRMVSLVHSPKYDIGLWGVEKLHAMDCHKSQEIHAQLVRDKVASESDFSAPKGLSREDFLLVHSATYLDSLKRTSSLMEALEFPALSFFPFPVIQEKVVEPLRVATAGTVASARKAIATGIGVNLAGGYHHAEAERGGGFCLFADAAIAIRKLKREKLIERALIVDTDLHQGNGNAKIFKDDQTVFTLSLHQEDIYPPVKAKSDLDIPLAPRAGDKEINGALAEVLPGLVADFQPELLIHIAGTDPYREDPLGNLRMTKKGILERDIFVAKKAREREVPLAVLMGGGYAPGSWRIHYESIRFLIQRYGLRRGAQK